MEINIVGFIIWAVEAEKSEARLILELQKQWLNNGAAMVVDFLLGNSMFLILALFVIDSMKYKNKFDKPYNNAYIK